MKRREYHHPTEPVICSECGQEYPPNTAICYECNRYLINDWMGDTGTPDNQVRAPQRSVPSDPDAPWDVDYRTIDQHPPQSDWDYLWHGSATASPLQKAQGRMRRTAWRLAGVLGAMYLIHMAIPFPIDTAASAYQRIQNTLTGNWSNRNGHATTPTAPTSQVQGQTVTMHGTVSVSGQATAPVIIWQYADGKWVHEQGTALLDTGGGPQSTLNGTALKAHGGIYNPALGTIQYSGIGNGTSTGYYWPHMFVAPLTDPHAYFIANKTLTSGLGKAVDQQEVINIGLGTLDQGQFHVNGTTWTWTYPIQRASP